MNKNEFYEALNRNREYALEHWGIKGQKWGLRRFQNPDGTLTEEGKRHYGRMGELPKGHSLATRGAYNDMQRTMASQAEIGNKLREKGKHEQARGYMTSALANANDKVFSSPEGAVEVSRDVKKAQLKGTLAYAVPSVGSFLGGLVLARNGNLKAGLATIIGGEVLSQLLGSKVSSAAMEKSDPGYKERYQKLLNSYGKMTTDQIYEEFDKTFVKSEKAPVYDSKKS